MTRPSQPSGRGAFTLVLHAHLPYVLSHGTWPHGSDMLFECAAGSYIPLLTTFERLVKRGISPRVTMSVSPVLAEQLSDPQFGVGFEQYLGMRARTALENRDDFARQKRLHLAELAERWRRHYDGLSDIFLNRCDGDLLARFRRLQDGGHIEIITSCATHGYLPLLASDESVQAQVKQAIIAHERHFGQRPRGFWLPECGYRPGYRWASPLETAGPQAPLLRKGVEEFLAENGIQYFIVDTATLRGGAPRGVYLERFASLQRLWEQFRGSYCAAGVDGHNSPYQPYLVSSAARASPAVAVFGRDEETGIQVWSGEHGYPGDGWYLDFHRKHFPGGLRYWRVTSSDSDLEDKAVYVPEEAEVRLRENAHHFSHLVHEILTRHQKESGSYGILCAPYDAELFGHWWFEGPGWLSRVLEGIHSNPCVDLVTCSQYLARHTPQTAVALPEGSWGQGGFHWIWLNEWTTWIWEHIYTAEAEFPKLAREAGKQSDPTLAEIVAQAARELLLLQASDWPFLISTWTARDYAERRAALHHGAFARLAAMARRRAAGEELSVDDRRFLADCRQRDYLFPDIDVSWWAQLDRAAET